MSSQEAASHPGWEIAIARLVVGLAQGLALYLLYSAADAKTWPATDGLIFTPLLMVSLFVPLILAVSIGNLRATTLTIWAIVATAILAGLAWYDVWHVMPLGWSATPMMTVAGRSLLFPSFGVFFFTAVGIFVAQALIVGGQSDGRVIATYATHFDVAWKLALQAALAAAFVGVFWGVLILGAELFSLIGIEYFHTLLRHEWFAIPATTLAIAASIHLTDVRAGLIRGARTLCLVLLAWLLPLMTVIAAGFLGTLISTGLGPLWKTRFAAGYLLGASAILVILINAAYQDGDPERSAPRILRYASRLAGVLLVPLALIAGYAIFLRVHEYGWTTERVASVAILTMASWYAAGYAAAALLPGSWLIARWNFFAALLGLAVLLALFSPLADPVRVAVASQVARLESGAIDPAKFDYSWLRWDGGRYGDIALRKLAAEGMPGSGSAYVKSHASDILAAKERYGAGSPPTPVEVSTSVTVYPKGRVLPGYFKTHDWRSDKQGNQLPWCLRYTGYECDAFFIDAAGDGKDEILFLDMGASLDALFEQSPDGSWHVVSNPTSLWNCGGVVAAMRNGQFKLVPPPPTPAPRWRDAVVNGVTLSFPPIEPPPSCPN